MKSLNNSSVDGGGTAGGGADVCSGVGGGVGEPGRDRSEEPASLGVPWVVAPLVEAPGARGSLGTAEPRWGFLRRGGTIIRAERNS